MTTINVTADLLRAYGANAIEQAINLHLLSGLVAKVALEDFSVRDSDERTFWDDVALPQDVTGAIIDLMDGTIPAPFEFTVEIPAECLRHTALTELERAA